MENIKNDATDTNEMTDFLRDQADVQNKQKWKIKKCEVLTRLRNGSAIIKFNQDYNLIVKTSKDDVEIEYKGYLGSPDFEYRLKK